MTVITKPNSGTKLKNQRKPVRELKNLRTSASDKSSGLNRCHPPCRFNQPLSSGR